MPGQVWLGLAGELGSPETPGDHYSTRIGGPPVFPGSTTPHWSGSPAGSSPKCAVCGAPLSLVLQAYAPLPDLPDRVLLVLGCTSVGCGKSPGCWQAVRCQLPPQQQQQQQQQKETVRLSQPEEQAAQAKAACSNSAVDAAPAAGTGFDAVADDWGFGASGDESSFGGSWDAPQPPAGSNGSSALDFSDLTSALTATVQQQQQHQQREAQRKKEMKKQQAEAAAAAAAAECADSGGTAGSCRGTAGKVLPEFYLYSELEPDGASSKALPNKELQHVQQLLAAYEAAQGAGASTAAATANGNTQKPPAAAADVDGVGEGGASWAAEEYEPDNVQCMQRSYLKFMKRIARQPQQCARYSHNGSLLWPKSVAPQPGSCPQCGVARVFELQLMPALSQMVLEAAGMMQELGMAFDAAVVNAVANWDWCTVAVFTCQNSCSPGSQEVADFKGQCFMAAEDVFVVAEAECESQPGPAAGPGGAAGGASSSSAMNADIDDEGGSDE